MWIIDVAVAVAPVIGYYSQWQLIKKEQSIGSFSIDVCAILMISAILRIYFWITNGYAINLLFQAMFIIIIQVCHAILRPYCSTSACSTRFDPKTRASSNHSGDGTRSTNTVSMHGNIVKFLLIFTGFIAFLTFVSKLLWIPFYGTFVGFTSMSIEATLGLPQLLNNYRNKSV